MSDDSTSKHRFTLTWPNGLTTVVTITVDSRGAAWTELAGARRQFLASLFDYASQPAIEAELRLLAQQHGFRIVE